MTILGGSRKFGMLAVLVLTTQTQTCQVIVRSWTPTCLGHGRPPEVIEEQVEEGRRRPQVLVVEDRRDVVKHEAARQAVPVAAHHQSSQK